MHTSKDTTKIWQRLDLFAKSVYHFTISLAIFIICGGKLLFDSLHKLVNTKEQKAEFNATRTFPKRQRR